jgi:hypothetical protein
MLRYDPERPLSRKKGPTFRRDLSLWIDPSRARPALDEIVELAILVLLALLSGLLALTVRILLLLPRLLAAALLLTRLLPWVLVLLAGILVLIGHRDLLF